MEKLIGTFGTVMVVVALLVAVVPGPVSAAPARPDKGEACLVQDADAIEYLDPDCDFHEVFKYDKAGNVVALVSYQDHGHLPLGAVFPDEAVQFIIHVDCQCIYDGDYQVTLAPNGQYHSHGPINTR
jgi:hypothetical protein